jgi:hypothetical protein
MTASHIVRATLAAILALLILVSLTTHIARKLTFTGDEPRYLLYALSLNLEGKPVMSEEGYEQYRKRPTPRIGVAPYSFRDIQGSDSTPPSHSIVPSLIYAPVVTLLPLQQVRLISLLAATVGLWFLASLFVSLRLSLLVAMGCFVPAAIFLPALPYYFLALPEAFLFLLVCIAFWNICSSSDTLRSFSPAIISSCLAPFIHLRGSVLFLTVMLFLAFKLGWRGGARVSWRNLIWLVCIGSATMALVVLYNRVVYGNAFGSTNTARPSLTFASTAFLFFNWRHGLFAYAPIYLLSFAGLIAGLWRREPWALPSAIFLILLIAASAGPNPGESYPARFWMQGVPVLAICLIGFLQGRMQTVFRIGIYGVLFLVSSAHTILFMLRPYLYMEARNGASPYDYLFDVVPWLHLGFWLNLAGESQVQLVALCSCCVLIAVIALASIRRSRAMSVLATLLLLAAFELHRARPLRSSATVEANSASIAVLEEKIKPGTLIRLRLRAPWKGESPARPIEISDGITHWERLSRATVLLRSNGTWPVPLSFRINWEAADSELYDAADIRVVAGESWFVRALSFN